MCIKHLCVLILNAPLAIWILILSSAIEIFEKQQIFYYSDLYKNMTKFWYTCQIEIFNDA